MKVQSYLDRVQSGLSAAEFMSEFPHSVLVELEGQEELGAAGAAMTERLDSQAIRLMSKASSDADVFVLRPRDGSSKVCVGRALDVDVLVDHKSVSKRHAEFELGEGSVTLQDLGSTNGTFINSRQLEIKKSAPVLPDDTVRFGRATGYYVMSARGFFDYLVTLQRFGL